MTTAELLRAVTPALFGGLIGVLSGYLLRLWLWWYWRPKVEASISNESDCRVEFGDNTYLRIRVTNTGRVVVEGCRAWLYDIYVWNQNTSRYERSHYRETMPLIWAYSDKIDTVPIPPGHTWHADVIRIGVKTIKTARSGTKSRFAPEPQIRHPIEGGLVTMAPYRELFESGGRFIYRVVVSANGAVPKYVDVPYSWSKEPERPVLIPEDFERLPKPEQPSWKASALKPYRRARLRGRRLLYSLYRLIVPG